MDIIKNHLRPLFFYCGFSFARMGWRRILAKRRMFILMYHKVDKQAAPFFGVAVKPEVFERQIRFLKTFYEIVDFSELQRFESHCTSKKDLIILTFDDGYRSSYRNAFPVLKKYKVPATIFLATDYVNTNDLLWFDKLSWILYKTVVPSNRKPLIRSELPQRMINQVENFFASNSLKQVGILRSLAKRLKAFPTEKREEVLIRLAKACGIKEWPSDKDRAMLSWDEVKEMSRHGISFGSHTRSHPVLGDIPLDQVQQEIAESKEVIEEQIQKPVNTFAYPYGKKEDYSEDTVQMLREEGFEYACSTIVGYEQLTPEDPFSLKRKGAAPDPYLFL